ncbi:copper chaperone PCu(A)C [Undibacterium sp. CY18W]|uniref:Copper chaperone PCu(A)C n=1 Tax=Undibacterium hunanense TaxID=2762292 RepID=A0ABR6ZTT3_9BURK|nr:copper chaperone PCu(A)C [Undibacterium hunanense]MBC3919262.1 copper chaperone PCu(A)C [Undibacterium hunanense]
MKNFNKLAVLAALFSGLITSVQAQVTVKEAWARATVVQQKASGAFMQISSVKDAKLVEVRSPTAGIAEMHKMEMSDNIMKMRQVDSIDLPAGKTVELKPGGFHIMLMDLKNQIKDGDIVPLVLVVEGKDKKRETLEVKAIAKPLNQAAHH